MPFGTRPTSIVEGEYTTGAQEQLYIETNGMIAAFDADRGVTVWGSLQCPYYVHKALMALFDLPETQIRVGANRRNRRSVRRQGRISFHDCGARGALAMKTRRPVKIIYDRAARTWLRDHQAAPFTDAAPRLQVRKDGNANSRRRRSI